MGDGRQGGCNHVLKIICGSGTHSKDGPVLVHAIPKLLEEQDLEYYSVPERGILLVRLINE